MKIRPARAFRGTFRLPGDKSITHRAFMFGAISRGVTTIHGQVLTALGTAAIDDTGRSLLFTGGLGPGATPYDALSRAELP